MKLFGKLLAYPLLAVNILTALLLVFSCYGSMAAPIGRWPFASLSGLAFPFLYLLNLLFLFLWLITWKKGTLVPIITILICIGPTLKYFPLHFFKSEEIIEPHITIITYNTEGFGVDDNKNWTLKNPVLDYIVNLDADMVFMQEAANEIMNKCSKDKDFRKRYPYIETASGLTSVACFSKYPILASRNILFENAGNSCLYLRIQIGQDTLAVFNCHLQSNQLKPDEISESRQFIKNPTDSTHYDAPKRVLKKLLESTSQRAVQAKMIADLANNETARYVIVCGDFNDTPLSYAHHVFSRFMKDAYAKSGAGAGITYHEHKLYYRIDHIFCSNNITPLYTWIDHAQKDSDHYPVISKIQLTK